MVACNVLPPVPAVFGDGLARGVGAADRRGTEPWLLRWLEEQADGPYWRHGSVRPGYERITCPTMIVAGWADGYTNIAFRGFEALTCPKRVHHRAVGAHGRRRRRSRAAHRPRAGADPLVPPLARRRAERRSTTEPPIAVFVRRSTRPAPDLAEMRGEWRCEPTWPAERLATHVLAPATVRAATTIARPGRRRDAPRGSPARGGRRGGCPDDQRVDDARSLTYDWDRSSADLDVLGHPRVRLDAHLARARGVPVGRGSATSSPTAPRPSSGRAILNLTHRDGHDGTVGRSSRACRPRSRSSSRRPRGCSSRAIGCASRSRERTGRTPGRRRTQRAAPDRARERRARSSPSSTGRRRCPAPSLPPTTGKDTHAPATDARAAAGRLAVRGRRDRPRDPRRDELRLELRGALRRPRRGALRGRRSGCRRTTPARAWARATTRLPHRLARGGRARRRRASTCAPTPTPTTSSSTLVAEEVGPVPGVEPFRRERRFERRFPRHLA